MTAVKNSAKTSKRELVAKNYRLLRYQPLTFELKTGRDGKLLIYDDEKGHQRAIRHCPNEKSIYIDEQSDLAFVEPIIFKKGLLETLPHETTTQDFLDNHPKKGLVFDVIDEAGDAQELVDFEEIKIDVKQAIRERVKEENGIEELRIVVSVLGQDAITASKLTPAELKAALYDHVESNVGRFVDDSGNVTIFDDPEIKRAAIAQQAFLSGVIQLTPNASQIVWADTKNVICNIPTGMKYLDFFANYLATEDGMQVAVEISKRA